MVAGWCKWSHLRMPLHTRLGDALAPLHHTQHCTEGACQHVLVCLTCLTSHRALRKLSPPPLFELLSPPVDEEGSKHLLHHMHHNMPT